MSDRYHPTLKLNLHVVDRGFSPLDVKPGHECAEDVEDEMIGLELLSTTLDLIPNEPSLVEYLMDGDVRVLVRYGDPESKRIHPLAGSYIQVIFGQLHFFQIKP